MRVRTLGHQPYLDIEAAMRDFTAGRDAGTEDELWLVEHEPVFTQGIAGRDSHVHAPGNIPVLRTGRGGQVTYHGPGQVVAYPLLDLRRLRLHVKEYVFRLEQAVLAALAHFGLTGHRVPGAPGVYLRLADPAGHAVLRVDADHPFAGLGKVAALGIKVSRHCSWHGLALNVAMDLGPYARIAACGYAGLRSVDLRSAGVEVGWAEAAAVLAQALRSRLEAH